MFIFLFVQFVPAGLDNNLVLSEAILDFDLSKQFQLIVYWPTEPHSHRHCLRRSSLGCNWKLKIQPNLWTKSGNPAISMTHRVIKNNQVKGRKVIRRKWVSCQLYIGLLKLYDFQAIYGINTKSGMYIPTPDTWRSWFEYYIIWRMKKAVNSQRFHHSYMCAELKLDAIKIKISTHE